VSDSAPVILEKARDALVLLAPGNAFATTEGPSRFARAAYSVATDETIDEALRRFGEVLRAAKAENGLVVEVPEAAVVASGDEQ
jgi:DNA-binding transcriptional MocR family regulator